MNRENAGALGPEEGVRVGRPSKYSPEFRRDAVALVHATGRPINQVARELGLSHETLRNWVKRDQIDRGQGEASVLRLRFVR